MSALDHPETEHILIGSILEADETKELPNPSPLQAWIFNHNLQSDSIIENQDSSEKNCFDSFNRSFEYMSIGSDQAGSPRSPQIPYQTMLQQQMYRSEGKHNTSHSFDGLSFSTQENSINYRNAYQEDSQFQTRRNKKFQSHCYMKLPNGMQPPYQTQHKPNVPSNFQNNWQPMMEIYDDIQLGSEIDNMCGNQILSRKIQKIFESGKQEQRDLIFSKVERSCVQFSKDVFGNYLIQRIFDKGTPQQVSKLFNKIRPHIYELSNNNFGCRVVQKIADIIVHDSKLQDQFLQPIKSQIKSLIYDPYGNFVILKCLEVMPSEKLEFMVKPIEDSVIYMCSQQYGCKIILRVIELFSEEQTDKILEICLKNQKFLYPQEYGNHILQHAIRTHKHIDLLCNSIFPEFEDLCMNKYSSNTVEKLVETIINQPILLETLLRKSQQNQQYVFVNISINPFGNYVMKKFLIMSNPQYVEPIIRIMRSDYNVSQAIRRSEYGQRICMILDKIMTQAN